VVLCVCSHLPHDNSCAVGMATAASARWRAQPSIAATGLYSRKRRLTPEHPTPGSRRVRCSTWWS
jgi:hypothetical protein